jgi:uncharacterized ferritin-like protein (DUF455 family)
MTATSQSTEGTAERSLVALGRSCLQIADPTAKAQRSRLALALAETAVPAVTEFDRQQVWPQSPTRTTRPVLVEPRDLPRRSSHSASGRIALFHALAHIELNAIDLAWDVAGRFAGASELGDESARFVRDWTRIAAEEAGHFLLLQAHLRSLGAAYGELPAHGGLWDAAETTANDLAARLAIVPLVHEARGLDVTPALIGSLKQAGDAKGAACLEIIYRDEIGHVRCGMHWFERVCRARSLEPISAFAALVRRYHSGTLKPPFNGEGRAAAGVPPALYEQLARVSGS